MTTDPMTCARFADLLSPYLEGELDAGTIAALGAHAAGCAECSALRADLEQIRAEAAELPLLVPSRDLWAGIAERIEPAVLPLENRRASGWPAALHRRATGHGGRARMRRLRPALAAAALVAVTAGITYFTTRRMIERGTTIVAVTEPAPGRQVPVIRPETVLAPAAPQVASGRGIGTTGLASERGEDEGEREAAGRSTGPRRPKPGPAAERLGRSELRAVANSAPAVPAAARQVEQLYGGEISRLRAIVTQRRAQLDSATVDVIEKNLAIIDSAIVQSRRAIARDPASGFLLEQLNSAYDKKVELLRTAAMLPARS